MLAGAVARAGNDAGHPNRRCRATNNHIHRAYHASVLPARLVCTNSLLMLYLEGLLQDLASAAPSDELSEMVCVADMLFPGTSAYAQSLGQSMASVAQACHQVWLSQSSLADRDCIAVLAVPVVTGEFFGLTCETALEQSCRRCELMRTCQPYDCVGVVGPLCPALWFQGCRTLPPRGSQAGVTRFASILFAVTTVKLTTLVALGQSCH